MNSCGESLVAEGVAFRAEGSNQNGRVAPGSNAASSILHRVTHASLATEDLWSNTLIELLP